MHSEPRVVVVTGSAGAIGSAVRKRFEGSGETVVGLDLAGGDLVCDISDEDAVVTAFAKVEAEHGPAQVLINNAGLTGAGSVTEEDPPTWRRILDVNLTGAYLCCRSAIPQMRRAGAGKIVNVVSVNARFGGSALSGPGYAASKGGLLTLTRFLAREHAADNIQVNAVAPGPHDTPMWHALEPALRERILGMLPGGTGPGDPTDLAATIEFLCGPETGYITGATVDVNGGQWMG